MRENERDGRQGPVYRVDKFEVPDAARAELLRRIEATHRLLRARKGFRRDLVLEQVSGPGTFNVVTLVEWDGEEAISAAREAVMAMHRSEGFDAEALFARTGIRADLAAYRAVPGARD